MAISEVLGEMLERIPEEERSAFGLGRLVAESGLSLEEVGIRSYPCCGKNGSCNHGIVPIDSAEPNERDYGSTDGIYDFVEGFFSAPTE